MVFVVVFIAIGISSGAAVRLFEAGFNEDRRARYVMIASDLAAT